MKIWKSGRESSLLDDMIEGRKTIEGRLNKGKFSEYRPGDMVVLRRDFRNAYGVLADGDEDAARVKVVAVRKYASFMEMATKEDYKAIIPGATSAEEAASEYRKYYSEADEKRFGVLAIEVKIAS